MFLQPMPKTRFVGRISRPKLTGTGQHAGVLLPDGTVAHKTPDGAAIVSFEEFSAGRPVKAEKAAAPESHRQLLLRAHASIGRVPPYHLGQRNCEHYATWLMGEAPRSEQVDGLATLGLLGVVLLACSS